MQRRVIGLGLIGFLAAATGHVLADPPSGDSGYICSVFADCTVGCIDVPYPTLFGLDTQPSNGYFKCEQEAFETCERDTAKCVVHIYAGGCVNKGVIPPQVGETTLDTCCLPMNP